MTIPQLRIECQKWESLYQNATHLHKFVRWNSFRKSELYHTGCGTGGRCILKS